MNNKQTLITITAEQELSRIVKAHELYINGLVEQDNDHTFWVKGQYKVEDIGTEYNAIMTCTCPDFEYREISRCKHIIAVELYLLDKANGA